VTGASSGSGYKLARQFTEHRFDVLAAAEDPRYRHRRAGLGGSSQPVRVDLATYDGVESLCRPSSRRAARSTRSRSTPAAASAATSPTTDPHEELNVIDVNTSTVDRAKRLHDVSSAHNRPGYSHRVGAGACPCLPDVRVRGRWAAQRASGTSSVRPARSWLRAAVSRRETCIWETPIFLAIWAWVMSS
jgi:hypothetical protein